MATGEILCGASGLPLYGKNGTILYGTPISMSINVVISWSGGKDVDICAFYSHGGGSVGYSHDSTIDVGDGFTANWTSGDNTQGGPETVSLAYSGSRGLKGKSFEIHANWYSVGTDSDGNELSGGGPATVTATDSKVRRGVSRSCPAPQSTERHKPEIPAFASISTTTEHSKT